MSDDIPLSFPASFNSCFVAHTPPGLSPSATSPSVSVVLCLCPMPHAPLLATVLLLLFTSADAFIGFNFALMLQKNPMPLAAAAQKLRDAYSTVTHIKLFDYNKDYISALQRVGLTDVMIAVPNGELPALSQDQDYAKKVAGVLVPFVSAGMRFTVAVGNEPLAPWYNGAYDTVLLAAVTNMREALRALGLASRVRVTVPFSFGMLCASYPPSVGEFCANTQDTVRAVVRVLRNDTSFFLVCIMWGM